MYLNNEIKQLELKYETSFVVHKVKLKEYYRKNEDTHTHLKVRKLIQLLQQQPIYMHKRATSQVTPKFENNLKSIPSLNDKRLELYCF